MNAIMTQFRCKLLNNQNLLVYYGFLLIIMIISFILGNLAAQILPATLATIPIPMESSIITIPLGTGLFALLLRVLLKNSIYFRLSISMVINALITGVGLQQMTYAGNTLESLIIIVPTITIPAFFLVIYVVNSVQTPIDTIAEDTKMIANGEMVRQERNLESFGHEFGELEGSFNKMVQNLSEIIVAVQSSTEEVAASAEEMASTSEEVNALSEEIASTIQQISRGASQQTQIAADSINNLDEMSKTVDQTINEIKGAIEIITDVAEQTNILALNAAIEAARAGESGRGFAVVADNVRRLAEDTKRNADDISKLTNEITLKLANNVSKLKESLESFSTQSEEYSASSEEVAAATEEQTASMSEMTASAQQLTHLSEELSHLVSRFNTK